ncbi:MAG TPA: RHS repeat-associated core domain-containing protein, partial [Phycisphaerae bacterium]|nr:RHS repeat-associated core domain-containing protein [Phycisphaerae bacterium]
ESGSAGIHGAGGIGGLLAAVETTAPHAGSYWFLYDGNGNVGQVIRASDQGIAARYEYDPYGTTLVAEGAYAAANPFRFSTKWLDTETGHVHYPYRPYEPRLGRWLARDPMGEKGGRNLYAALANRPPMVVDAFGLQDVIIGRPPGIVAPPGDLPLTCNRPIPPDPPWVGGPGGPGLPSAWWCAIAGAVGECLEACTYIGPFLVCLELKDTPDPTPWCPPPAPAPQPAPQPAPKPAPAPTPKKLKNKFDECKCKFVEGKLGYARGHTPGSLAEAYELRVCGTPNCSLINSRLGCSAGYDSCPGKASVCEAKYVDNPRTPWLEIRFSIQSYRNQQAVAASCDVPYVIRTNSPHMVAALERAGFWGEVEFTP